MKRSLREAASAVGGRLIGADREFEAVSIDSRGPNARALFVALTGPKHDGADFAAAAAAAGAVGALVARELPIRLPQIVVADSLRALQILSLQWRLGFDIPVVAVAGSNGKTTVKEMTAAILSRAGLCLSTQGNLNNHIGVPLTLLRLRETHRSAVVEMGANRIGDVSDLMHLARPSVAVVTNAGAEHLEGFLDLDGVARGEGEAFACLDSGATAVINADDPYAEFWRGLAGARRILSFGVHGSAHYRAKAASLAIENGEFVTRFTLAAPSGEIPVGIHTGGMHNVMNAAAAAAAAAAAGATPEHIAQGLAQFRPVSGRLQPKAGIRGSFLIDDSYNANPSSVRAGLDVLRGLRGETWLVLGEMAELGAQTADCHAEVGAYARECGVRRLFALGAACQRAAASFGVGAEWFADADALIRRLQGELKAGVTVLVKGSRVNRLERVVLALAASRMPVAS